MAHADETADAVRPAPGVRSMTGFGAARAEADGLRIEAEVRSVNHRHLKIHVRTPESLTSLGPRIEDLVRGQLSRGTVYLQLRRSGSAGASAFQLDRPLLRRLHQELAEEAQALGVEAPSLGEVARLPGVVRPEEPDEEAETLWPLVERATSEALARLAAMRLEEGRGIAQDLAESATGIRCEAAEVEVAAPQASREQAERLRQRVAQLLGESQVQPGDLAREVALLADKTDISEELQRLKSHVGQLVGTVEGAVGPVGRKLEFLAQELLREANTMASKSNDTSIVQRVLGIKLLVERIREQVANVE